MQSWKVGRGSSKLCPWIRGHEAFTKAALLLPHTWKWVWIECNPHTSSPTPRQLGLSHLQFCIMFLDVSPSHCFHSNPWMRIGDRVQVSFYEKKAS